MSFIMYLISQFISLAIVGLFFYFFKELTIKDIQEKRKGIPVKKRIENIKALRESIVIFPFLGILGTVASLMSTFSYISTHIDESKNMIGALIGKFSPALMTTFLGVISSIIFSWMIAHKIKKMGGYHE